jgi:hypothetical protein
MTNTNETTTASSTDETTDAASHASPAQTERVETPSAETRDASDPRVERTVEAAGRIVEAARRHRARVGCVRPARGQARARDARTDDGQARRRAR